MVVTRQSISSFENDPVPRMRVKYFDPWPIDLYDMVSLNIPLLSV